MSSKSNNPKRSSAKKQILAAIITLVFLGLIIFFVLPQFGDYGAAFDQISTMQGSDLFLLSIFTVANILIYVLPYLAALPGLRYLPGFVLRQTSFLISNAVPAGGALGLGVQYAMLSSYNFSGGVASSAIILTSAWNLLATISLPGIAAIGLLLTGQLDSDSAIKAGVGVAIASVSLGLFFLIIKSKVWADKLGRWADRTVKKISYAIKKPIEVDVLNNILEFRQESLDVTTKRWHWLASSNYAQQISQFSVLFIALQILEPGSISVLAAFWAFAIARLGSFVPITPGGIGTVDALLVGFLVQGGMSNDAALAATLIWRFSTYIPQLVIGVITFLYWRFSQVKQQKTQTKNSTR